MHAATETTVRYEGSKQKLANMFSRRKAAERTRVAVRWSKRYRLQRELSALPANDAEDGKFLEACSYVNAPTGEYAFWPIGPGGLPAVLDPVTMQEPWTFTAGDNGAGVIVSFSYLHAVHKGSYRTCLDIPELDESKTTIRLANQLEENRLQLVAAVEKAEETKSEITELLRQLQHLEEAISTQSDNLYDVSKDLAAVAGELSELSETICTINDRAKHDLEALTSKQAGRNPP